MKHIVLFATLLILAGTACKKSKKVEPLDILPGNWELRQESLRSEPGEASLSLRMDKSFTSTVNGVVKSGTFKAHYINDQKGIEVILTTYQGDVIGVFYLEMVSVHEFRYGTISIGPGPSPKYILLRVK
ncbi:hypothetical protein AAHN97_27260 [Chitinophaga niabensis]|uniref:hypothetical protein n=1 Tax=Chitinophaga niabensis TaxID=536979 RepID=UPI0031BA41A5